MNKSSIYIFIFIVLLNVAAGYELSEYPGFFLEGGRPDVYIIVGDKAPASHVLAQADIALSLGTEFGQPLSGSSMLASQVDGISGLNLISIGNACDNAVTSEILGNPDPCGSGLGGKTAIKVFESEEGKAHVVITSGSEEGIKEAAAVLADFDDYSFSGDSYLMDSPEREEEAGEGTEEGPVEETVEEPEAEKTKDEEGKEEPAPVPARIQDEEPVPVMEDSDNLVKIFIDWVRSIFEVWRR